ncbi:cell surface receptor/MFS transporter [Coccidioides immitis RS]|uniref:Cell surface receptor/MFS transporter n=3 Tax=Coccidioides immitis TaxID=5501 RepID=J3KJG5_COCIM|nr:cell surface receptor/MFS transporter [Coccidioides immitis RS]EAS36208.3 cell surface receptor/MFS transporter [Coccidioides immitis RS]KMP01535.1 major facilitator superfamily protein domain-containing protein 7-a [Coccidioides immitis RMSCC 2394]KMU76488.1 major facilitator superfamily domain -containing protein 7-a [Coccidioides immitis RMSCC 3703]
MGDDNMDMSNVKIGPDSHDMKLPRDPDGVTIPAVSLTHDEGGYKVYKRRFFGLAQLVLLNVVVSWDWLTFSAVSKTSSEYFDVSEAAINWLSTGFLFAFCVASPAVIWTLNKGGPKPSIVACAALLLVGNWVRYAGTKAKDGIFGVTMFGQVLIGFAQPFVLTAPTRYSDAWFSDRGRTSATAVATLANPLGGALGQLIGPMWATKPSEIPNMVLYVAIISTVACIPSFFIPSLPPTPPSAAFNVTRIPLTQSHCNLFRALEFWLIFFPFGIYVGLFNSISSLLNQILEPHGFSETDAGITGALLIFVGLAAAAICSPVTDKHKHHLGTIKVLIPIVAATYIGFVFAPEAPSVAGPFVVAAILGAASFAILPVILEYLVEITYPMSPEIPSTLCWVGGQIFGAVFILVENALKAGPDADPPRNMKNALIFQAVMASVVIPAPLCLGLFGREVRKRRLEAEEQGRDRGGAGDELIPEDTNGNNNK